MRYVTYITMVVIMYRLSKTDKGMVQIILKRISELHIPIKWVEKPILQGNRQRTIKTLPKGFNQ